MKAKYLPVIAKMAFRNLLKYRRRSVETFVVVFVGLTAVALVDVFVNGFFDRIVSGFAVSGGHVRASAPGYRARRALCPLDKLVADPAALAEAAAQAVGPGGRVAAPAARIVALPSLRAPLALQFGEKSLNLYATGAEAFLEAAAGVGAAALAPPFASSPLASGRYPGQGERGLVLSARDAARLGARPGDAVVILASDVYGSFGAVELPLLGVARSDPGPDPCLVDLASMRALLGLDSGATEVALYLVGPEGSPLDPRRFPTAIRAMEAAVRAQGLEAEGWDSPGNPSRALIAFFDSFMYAMYAIFLVVAASGIANSVLLSVQDRTRDFATLRAVGFSAPAVQAIVALETLMLGAAASTAAIAAAAALVAAVGPAGLRLSGAVRGIADWMPEYIPARADAGALALLFLGGSLAPLISAAYPLAVLGRMKIREGLGYV